MKILQLFVFVFEVAFLKAGICFQDVCFSTERKFTEYYLTSILSTSITTTRGTKIISYFSSGPTPFCETNTVCGFLRPCSNVHLLWNITVKEPQGHVVAQALDQLNQFRDELCVDFRDHNAAPHVLGYNSVENHTEKCGTRTKARAIKYGGFTDSLVCQNHCMNRSFLLKLKLF